MGGLRATGAQTVPRRKRSHQLKCAAGWADPGRGNDPTVEYHVRENRRAAGWQRSLSRNR